MNVPHRSLRPALVFALIILFSCKREFDYPISTNNNEAIAHFFHISDSASDDLKFIKTAMLKEFPNEISVKNFLEWHGQPLWSNSLQIIKTEGKFKFYIPTKKPNEDFISTFIVASYSDNKVDFELHRRSSVINNVDESSKIGIDKENSIDFLSYFDSKVLHKYHNLLRQLYPANAKIKQSAKENLNPTNPESSALCYEYFCDNNNIVFNPFPPLCTYCFPPDEDPGPGGGGGGGGGGGSNPPCGSNFIGGWYNIIPLPDPCEPVPLSPQILFIKTLLNLDVIQTNWLIHYTHIPFAVEIYDYLQLNASPSRIAAAKEHLNLLMGNTEYLSFALPHAITHTQPGNPNLIWWEDEIWLQFRKYKMPEAAFNFYMKHTRPENRKPEEFANKCEGIKAMSSRTKNDHKERLGYVTYDGKFIITDVGDAETVQMNINIINGGVYYSYPLALGLPDLSYYGTIIDNQNQRVSILLRASVHTHPEGSGIPIDNFNSRSNGDLFSAQMILENVFFAFTNFVIEPYLNTYKTGIFDNNENNTQYLDVHTGLDLDSICQYITN